MFEFEIMFDDLTEAAQAELCRALETTLEDENWDIVPVAVVNRGE